MRDKEGDKEDSKFQKPKNQQRRGKPQEAKKTWNARGRIMENINMENKFAALEKEAEDNQDRKVGDKQI